MEKEKERKKTKTPTLKVGASKAKKGYRGSRRGPRDRSNTEKKGSDEDLRRYRSVRMPGAGGWNQN